MRIVFGTNHFKIKSFTPKELGLSEKEIEGVTIERRQKYFHLYWIPFVPTGKEWGIRKDGELFELPLEYKEALENAQIKTGTPIWAYTFPLLVVLGFAIYGIVEKVDNINSRRRSIARFDNNHTMLVNNIKNPSIYDYYEFDNVTSYTKNKYLKVFTFNNDSIQLQLPEEAYDGYSAQCGEVASCFNDTPDNFNLFWIKKSDMLKLVRQDYDNDDFKGSKIEMLDFESSYELEKIHHFRGPDFYDRGEGQINNNIISITLSNRGVQTTVTQINNVEGSINWQNQVPFVVGANQKFTLEGAFSQLPVYALEITCQDADSSYTYSIKGKGIERELIKI